MRDIGKSRIRGPRRSLSLLFIRALRRLFVRGLDHANIAFGSLQVGFFKVPMRDGLLWGAGGDGGPSNGRSRARLSVLSNSKPNFVSITLLGRGRNMLPDESGASRIRLVFPVCRLWRVLFAARAANMPEQRRATWAFDVPRRAGGSDGVGGIDAGRVG